MCPRFDSGSCHHRPTSAQVTGEKDLATGLARAKPATENAVASHNYASQHRAPVAPETQPADGARLTPASRWMASRSKPVQIKLVRWRDTGTATYRITGTIRGRQRCAFRGELEDAHALADTWETEGSTIKPLSGRGPRG